MASTVKLKANVNMSISASLVSQDVASNRSRVNVVVKLIHSTGGSFTYAGKGDGYRIRYDMSGPQNWSYTRSWRDYSWTIGNMTLWSSTISILHNSDGSISGNTFKVTMYGQSGSTLAATGGHTADVSISIPDIPRVSKPTVNHSSRNLGSTVRITTNRANTSFTHTVQYSVGSLGWTNIQTGVGAYVDWTLPNSIASYIASNRASGSVSIRVITYSGSTQIGSATTSLTAVIPASKPTVNHSSRNLGSTVRVTTNRVSTSLTHTVQYSVGSLGWTNISTGVGAYIDWTLPNSIASYIASNKTSRAVSIRVITYNGSTQIGSATTSLTAVIPNTTTFRPNATISSVTEGASLPSGITDYVQGHSRFKVTSSGSGKYGATISAYRVTIDGVHYNGNSITSNVLRNSGSRSIALRVTDSRGFSTTVSTTRSVTAYSPPKLTSVSARRSPNDQGTNLSASINFTISSISNQNSKQYRIRYRATGGSWVSLFNSTAYYTRNTTHSATEALNVNSSYEVEFYIKDSFATVTQTRNISTAFQLIDFNKSGRGMAIGKVSESNRLEVAMPASFTGGMWHTTNKSLDSIVAIDRSPDTWNTPGNTNLYLRNNNNALSVIVNGVENRRVAMIQVGHENPNFAQHLGTLRLNPLGGAVTVNNETVLTADSGSNENGRYIKFSDGTMICYRHVSNVTGLTTSNATAQGINTYRGNVLWTFPASFIALPSVTNFGLPYMSSTSRILYSPRLYSLSNTLAGLQFVGVEDFNRVTDLTSIAIGRWK